MKTISGIKKLPSPLEGSIVTIGNFDGVHVGHRKVIEQLVSDARKASVPAVVMTFDPHPLCVLRPEFGFKRIFDLADQVSVLSELGVDHMIVEPFSRHFSQQPPEVFLQDWIFAPLSPLGLIVGYDFSFGAHRGGQLEFLESECQRRDLFLKVIDAKEIDDKKVSSTRIRNVVEKGDVALAEKLLGRPFYLNGIVQRGEGRGKKIGVPTVNLKTSADLTPKGGVYVSRCWVDGNSYQSVTNIGVKPTFNDQGSLHIETHIFSFDEEIYGRPFKVEFMDFLRDEKKFENIESLVAQIQEDIRGCQEFYHART